MTSFTSALITPSFRGDYERCRWLVESVARHVVPSVKHYLVIDRRDVPLFKSLENARTHILVVEDVLPWWLMRIPGVPKVWMSFKTLPVRNWILQQLVKLSMPLHVPEDLLFFVDSDTFFANPFDPDQWLRDGRAPLLMERDQAWRDDHNNVWQGVASQMLGLPKLKTYDSAFIGNVICWRRDVVLKLHAHLEQVGGISWQRQVARQLKFSEYILYGAFCERVLGIAEAGHWEDGVIRTLCHWDTKPLNPAGLAEFRAQLSPEHHSVMVSAKSGTRIEDVRRAFS